MDAKSTVSRQHQQPSENRLLQVIKCRNEEMQQWMHALISIDSLHACDWNGGKELWNIALEWHCARVCCRVFGGFPRKSAVKNLASETKSNNCYETPLF